MGCDDRLLPLDHSLRAIPSVSDLVERYVALGLRLGRHNPDIVDSYYGPPMWRERVAAEALRPPESLAEDARRMIAELDGGIDLGSIDLGIEIGSIGRGSELRGADMTGGAATRGAESAAAVQRRVWLRSQLVGLHTVGRVLAGDPVPYLDEVEACYGIRPLLVDPEEIEAAHVSLDAALPGSGALPERISAMRDRHAIPVERLPGVIDNLASELRERTRASFGLPDGEIVDFELVRDKPYSGFNFYLGDLRSRVTINTDLPVLSTAIAHLVAHEAYPGHHTEHCHKEIGLVRRRRQLEESIALVGTPAGLMAEGLADLGLEALMGSEPHAAVEPMIRDAGLVYELEAVAALAGFAEVAGRVRGTLAVNLHAEGRDREAVVADAERWLLLDHARASKAVEFLADPTWRAYVFCYAEGHRRCRAFVAGDPARFSRLLDEQLTPADLVGRSAPNG